MEDNQELKVRSQSVGNSLMIVNSLLNGMHLCARTTNPLTLNFEPHMRVSILFLITVIHCVHGLVIWAPLEHAQLLLLNACCRIDQCVWKLSRNRS